MSVRHYNATAIDCDVCGNEHYHDSCETSVENLVTFARRDGWVVSDEGRDAMCPGCVQDTLDKCDLGKPEMAMPF